MSRRVSCSFSLNRISPKEGWFKHAFGFLDVNMLGVFGGYSGFDFIQKLLRLKVGEYAIFSFFC